MKERGLMFCQELVPKVLDGSKFVTRRLGGLKEINENPDLITDALWCESKQGWYFYDRGGPRYFVKCRQGLVGDRFYLKETWALIDPDFRPIKSFPAGTSSFSWTPGTRPIYKADHITGNDGPDKIHWRSPMFMPKAAARPQRWELISIRPERLQEITEADALAEGVEIIGHRENGRARILMRLSGKYPPCEYLNAAQDNIVLAHFASLWDTINAKCGYAWEKNPWVWRMEWNPKPVAESKSEK